MRHKGGSVFVQNFMKRHLIVVTKGIFKNSNAFSDMNFLPVWCDFDVIELGRVKSSSSDILLVLSDMGEHLPLQFFMYLRDLCIDEEKNLYLYGPKRTVLKVKKLIPSLFILGAFDDSVHLVDLLKFVESHQYNGGEVSKPSVFIMDDDVSFAGNLKSALSMNFDVVLSGSDMADAGYYLKNSDIVILSTSLRITILEYVSLIRAIKTRNGKGFFRLFFLTDTKSEQVQVMSLNGLSSLCLSRETGEQGMAAFLINNYSRKFW